MPPVPGSSPVPGVPEDSPQPPVDGDPFVQVSFTSSPATAQLPVQVMLQAPAEQLMDEPSPASTVQLLPEQETLHFAPHLPEQVEPGSQASWQFGVEGSQASKAQVSLAGQAQLFPEQYSGPPHAGSASPASATARIETSEQLTFI